MYRLTPEELEAAFSSWWKTSKYTQVILPSDFHRTIALDGWRAMNDLLPERPRS